MLIEQQKLTDFVTEIFTTAGSTEVVAREVSEHLVAANLKGHDSHGVGMVPTYDAESCPSNLEGSRFFQMDLAQDCVR